MAKLQADGSEALLSFGGDAVVGGVSSAVGDVTEGTAADVGEPVGVEGVGAVVGAVATPGVEADDGEVEGGARTGAAELTGPATGPGTGIPITEQRLGAGVVTLHAAGSCSARVTLMPRGSVKVVLYS